MEVRYNQGMTKVWSDGEKIVVTNTSGVKHVEFNVDQIFGMGEWFKIHNVLYTESRPRRNLYSDKVPYECVSGYIPQRVIDDLQDLASQPDIAEDELPEDVKKANALDAIREI